LPHARARRLEIEAKLTLSRTSELAAVEAPALVAVMDQAEAAAGGPEAGCQHIRISAAAGLTYPEPVVIIFTAASLAYETHHVLGAVRKMHVEPFDEQGLHFVRQAQE
jgi:hypothetical protein